MCTVQSHLVDYIMLTLNNDIIYKSIAVNLFKNFQTNPSPPFPFPTPLSILPVPFIPILFPLSPPFSSSPLAFRSSSPKS